MNECMGNNKNFGKGFRKVAVKHRGKLIVVREDANGEKIIKQKYR